jgi:hypothetical protein
MIGDLIHVGGELVEVVAEARMTLPAVETQAERALRLARKLPAPEFGYGILRVRPLMRREEI